MGETWQERGKNRRCQRFTGDKSLRERRGMPSRAQAEGWPRPGGASKSLPVTVVETCQEVCLPYEAEGETHQVSTREDGGGDCWGSEVRGKGVNSHPGTWEGTGEYIRHPRTPGSIMVHLKLLTSNSM